MSATATVDQEELNRLYRVEVKANLLVNVLRDYLDRNLPVVTAELRADLARTGL